MDILRTDDARFANLKDFPFKPHYTQIDTAEGAPAELSKVIVDLIRATAS